MTGIDASDFVIRFIHDKVVFIPKHADTHTTFHFGPRSKRFDLHETRQTDGANRTIFRMPHANLAPLVEELWAPLLEEVRGLARPLRPGWMVRNQIGAVLGLLPQDEKWRRSPNSAKRR